MRPYSVLCVNVGSVFFGTRVCRTGRMGFTQRVPSSTIHSGRSLIGGLQRGTTRWPELLNGCRLSLRCTCRHSAFPFSSSVASSSLSNVGQIPRIQRSSVERNRFGMEASGQMPMEACRDDGDSTVVFSCPPTQWKRVDSISARRPMH